MRLIQTAVLCAAFALPSVAHSQSIKLERASMAGMCAAAVEFVAGARSSAGVARPIELQTLQFTRDLYLRTPGLPPGEVEGYANAWSQRMTENIADAPDEAARGKVAQRIGTVAEDCQNRMVRQVKSEQLRLGTPQPAPTQPLTTQPYTTVPLDTQPLTTQPYVIQ